jgi:hypothetical protein
MGTVQDTVSGAFTAGAIAVEDNTGSVTFTTTRSNSGLSVSAAGLISTTGLLTTGTWTVSGTDSDASGDAGTWTHTLTVTALAETVTFEANGGFGVMAPETASETSALSLNIFTWATHTFKDWNTAVNGSGASYANGASYPFTASVELFAQWKSGKVPSRTVTFEPNGGTGPMESEMADTPTALSANHFTRAGYTFLAWSTSPRGTGSRFKNAATYPFKRYVVLYALWKQIPLAPPLVVRFNPNGGTGTMAPEAQP